MYIVAGAPCLFKEDWGYIFQPQCLWGSVRKTCIYVCACFYASAIIPWKNITFRQINPLFGIRIYIYDNCAYIMYMFI